MPKLPRRIDEILPDVRWEAGRRNAIVGKRLYSGRENGLSCQDQFARSFNGIKGHQGGILELGGVNECVIHWEISWGIWASHGEMGNSDRSIHFATILGDKEPRLSGLPRS